jgi:hypothetical protein
VPAAARRRIDPLCRTATVAVGRLLGAARPGPDTALVLSTSYGAVESTFKFVGSIAAYGDEGASPTPFTTSVHNSCAGALGEYLGLHGPATTLSQGGLGTIAALRWAAMTLAAGRAPEALVVIGDRHNDWSRNVVTALAGARWPIGDGVVACRLAPGPGEGRELRFGRHPAAEAIDGGSPLAADEAALAARAAGQRRTVAPDALGRWWPCCTALPLVERWRDAAAIALREAEDGALDEAWLGPWGAGS